MPRALELRLRREAQKRALVCLVLASHRLPWHCLLIRRYLRSGELAFHYCFVPEGQPLTITRLIRAAGLRWPVPRRHRQSGRCFIRRQARWRALWPAALEEATLGSSS
jgi:hypothetical protein